MKSFPRLAFPLLSLALSTATASTVFAANRPCEKACRLAFAADGLTCSLLAGLAEAAAVDITVARYVCGMGALGLNEACQDLCDEDNPGFTGWTPDPPEPWAPSGNRPDLGVDDPSYGTDDPSFESGDYDPAEPTYTPANPSGGGGNPQSPRAPEETEWCSAWDECLP
jgi:hypothetical protein